MSSTLAEIYKNDWRTRHIAIQKKVAYTIDEVRRTTISAKIASDIAKKEMSDLREIKLISKDYDKQKIILALEASKEANSINQTAIIANKIALEQLKLILEEGKNIAKAESALAIAIKENAAEIEAEQILKKTSCAVVIAEEYYKTATERYKKNSNKANEETKLCAKRELQKIKKIKQTALKKLQEIKSVKNDALIIAKSSIEPLKRIFDKYDEKLF